MKTYNFYAIQRVKGGSIGDRYQLEAVSFAEACVLAQEDEVHQAIGEDREPIMYNEFKEIIPAF